MIDNGQHHGIQVDLASSPLECGDGHPFPEDGTWEPMFGR